MRSRSKRTLILRRVICPAFFLTVCIFNVNAEDDRSQDDRLKSSAAPICVARNLFDQSDPAMLGLKTVEGEHALLYLATKDGYKFCHHANLAVFKGRMYAMWSNGMVHEDSNGQRVLYCHSGDGLHWTKPAVLVEDPDGKKGPMACVAAGFLASDERLVAYYTSIVQRKHFRPENALFAVVSTDAQNWSRPTRIAQGFFIDGPRRLPSGRLLLNGQFPNKQPHILFSDASDGVTDWTDATIPPSNAFSFPEPTWFTRRDGTVVMLFRTRSGNFRLYAATSRDNGRTWTAPVETNYPDATARTYAGNLPDGTAFIINNPCETPGSFSRIGKRIPLTISLSDDGITFDRAYVIHGEPTDMRYKGASKLAGWQYPAACVWKRDFYVAYSINKEDVGVTRIPLDALSRGKARSLRK